MDPPASNFEDDQNLHQNIPISMHKNPENPAPSPKRPRNTSRSEKDSNQNATNYTMNPDWTQGDGLDKQSKIDFQQILVEETQPSTPNIDTQSGVDTVVSQAQLFS